MTLGLNLLPVLEPLERGIVALERMADALEGLSWAAQTHVQEAYGKART